METTIFEIEFIDGRVFRVYCEGKNQIKRFVQSKDQIKDLTKKITTITSGIHTINQWEKIAKRISDHEN